MKHLKTIRKELLVKVATYIKPIQKDPDTGQVFGEEILTILDKEYEAICNDNEILVITLVKDKGFKGGLGACVITKDAFNSMSDNLKAAALKSLVKRCREGQEKEDEETSVSKRPKKQG